MKRMNLLANMVLLKNYDYMEMVRRLMNSMDGKPITQTDRIR